MEKHTESSTGPSLELKKQFGTTALFFIEPFSDSSYLDNPNTYFGKIDENNTYDEIDTDHEEVTPSYAQNNQDYRLLRRSQRSNVKRANRREHKRHNR